MLAKLQTYTNGPELHPLQPAEFDCQAARELLDDLFSRIVALEDADASAKHALFVHLEACTDCCRAFDARLRFGAVRRNSIY